MIRTLSVLFLTATTASACPTFEDLETGVVLNEAAGSTYAVRHVAGGLYWHGQMSNMFPDQWQSFKHLGAFEVFVQRASGSGKQFRTYSNDITTYDDVQDGQTLTSVTEWGDPAGAALWSADLSYRVQAREAVAIGDCTYAALSIVTKGDLTLPNGDVRPVSETETYLPELRFILPYGDMVSVRIATDEDEVPTDARLIELGQDTPMLGDIMARYGLTP